MSYKISIVKVETVPIEQREWLRVADTGNPMGGGPQYAYQTFPSTATKETKVLEQQVDEVDLKAVIRALNGL